MQITAENKRKASKLVWCLKNPAKVKANGDRWRKANRERHNAKVMRHYWRNKDIICTKHKLSRLGIDYQSRLGRIENE